MNVPVIEQALMQARALALQEPPPRNGTIVVDKRTGEARTYVLAADRIKFGNSVLPKVGLVLRPRGERVEGMTLVRLWRLTSTVCGDHDEWETRTGLDPDAPPDQALTWAKTHALASVIRDLLPVEEDAPDPSSRVNGRDQKPQNGTSSSSPPPSTEVPEPTAEMLPRVRANTRLSTWADILLTVAQYSSEHDGEQPGSDLTVIGDRLVARFRWSGPGKVDREHGSSVWLAWWTTTHEPRVTAPRRWARVWTDWPARPDESVAGDCAFHGVEPCACRTVADVMAEAVKGPIGEAIGATPEDVEAFAAITAPKTADPPAPAAGPSIPATGLSADGKAPGSVDVTEPGQPTLRVLPPIEDRDIKPENIAAAGASDPEPSAAPPASCSPAEPLNAAGAGLVTEQTPSPVPAAPNHCNVNGCLRHSGHRGTHRSTAVRLPLCRECDHTPVDFEGLTCQACIDADGPLPGDEEDEPEATSPDDVDAMEAIEAQEEEMGTLWACERCSVPLLVQSPGRVERREPADRDDPAFVLADKVRPGTVGGCCVTCERQVCVDCLRVVDGVAMCADHAPSPGRTSEPAGGGTPVVRDVDAPAPAPDPDPKGPVVTFERGSIERERQELAAKWSHRRLVNRAPRKTESLTCSACSQKVEEAGFRRGVDGWDGSRVLSPRGVPCGVIHETCRLALDRGEDPRALPGGAA